MEGSSWLSEVHCAVSAFEAPWKVVLRACAASDSHPSMLVLARLLKLCRAEDAVCVPNIEIKFDLVKKFTQNICPATIKSVKIEMRIP